MIKESDGCTDFINMVPEVFHKEKMACSACSKILSVGRKDIVTPKIRDFEGKNQGFPD
jgi:hypothetical protein